MTTMNREKQKQVLIDTANHIINRDNTSPYSENLRELARIALASLEAEPVAWVMADDLRDNAIVSTPAYPCLDDAKERTIGSLIALYAAPPVPVVPAALPENDDEDGHDIDYLESSEVYALGRTTGWNACRAAMLQSGNFRENKNSSTNNFREIAETSTNYPVIPSEVLSAILKVAKIRADFDDFDGDRRGIGDCLDEAEQELIVTINKYASQLAAEPIATNDVREQQTAVPPVPEIQDDVAQAIENLKQKLVECNRYNYCADAVKGVEDACHAAMLQGRERLVLDAATRTAAGGEMMDVKEKVLQVMRSRAALQDKALGGEYPFRMATWNLRLAMEKEFPDEEWRSADLRKILMELAKDGTVSKDTHASRIGQAVWRLEVR